MMKLFQTYKALRDDECTDAFKTAFYMEVTMRYLPHRLYLAMAGGRHLDPMPMKWVWRRRTLWKSSDWPEGFE